MILTNAKMFESIPVLAQAKDETGLLGYAIAVNLRKLSTETVEFAQKRAELLAFYGTDKGAGQYELDKEQQAAFYEALAPFAQIETDVAVLQVSPEVFYGGNLTSGQMYALSWMVKEGEDNGAGH